jgi:L-ascorbate metabolism protein UlaG (beta-lactamase superfamily)
MRSFARTAFALLLCTTALAGSARAQTATRAGPVPCDGACTDTVEVRFLGAGGFLVRHGGDAVITGPLFSNPPLLRVALGRSIHADTARIDEGMERVLPDRRGISAILVGHSHYDHLMDVPYVAARYLPGVPVLGNRTMLNLLAWDTALVPRLHAVEDSAGTWRRPGRWIYPRTLLPGSTGGRRDSTVRVMAVESEHTPHAFGLVKLFHRSQDTPMRRPPRSANEWAEGRTHSFVVEFRDSVSLRLLFRVQYQDAVARPPRGFPPFMEGGYDLALVCGGNYEQVRDGSYPGALLRWLAPRNVLVGHWESFFRPQTEPLRDIPLFDTGELFRRVRREVKGDVEIPVPGQSVRYCICGSREWAPQVPPTV